MTEMFDKDFNLRKEFYKQSQDKERQCERCGKEFEANSMYPKTRLPKIKIATETTGKYQTGYKQIKNPLICPDCLRSLIHFLARWWVYQK